MSTRDHSRRFHFLRQIASGGFGSVYLVKVMHTDGFSRIAAVKLLHERWSDNREIAQRMRDEARLLGWLHHRNIVDVIDLTTIGGRVAVVMEYLEAVDLKTIGAATGARGETMGARAAMEVLAAVASALDAAYNRPPYQGEKPLRVIHRDIKPSNIMIDESGTVKVLDFGVARADFEQRESHTQELQFGSLDYMPPERLFHEPEGGASDVYSLGSTLYEVLGLGKLGKAKGKSARHAEMVRERLEGLPAVLELPPSQAAAVCGLLGRMLSHGADERPTAGDVGREARALARLLDGEGLQEWAERVIPPLVREAREAPREPDPLIGLVLSEDSPARPSMEATDPGLYDLRPAEPSAGPNLARSPAGPPDDDGGMATLIYDTPSPQRQAGVRSRAMPVARPPNRRGPPPPVTLEPPVALADDPSVLSAPFPRTLDAGRGVLQIAGLAAGAEAADAEAREAPPDAAPVPEAAPARRTYDEDDDNSDAHLVEVHRSSPTLVFPLEVDARAEDEEPEATVPGRALVERAGVPNLAEAPTPDEPIPAPAPFPRAGSALALPPAVEEAPPPPDPSVVSHVRPSRADAVEARPAPGPASPGPVAASAPVSGPSPVGSTPVAPAAPSQGHLELGPSSPESWEDRGTRPGTPVIIRKVIVAGAGAEMAPVARVRRAAPPQPDPTPAVPAPEPTPVRPTGSSGSGRWLWVVGAVLVMLSGVTIVGAWWAWQWWHTPESAPVATAAPAAVVPEPEAPPELAAGAIRFLSGATGTTRLTASCDGVEIAGTTWVDWTGASPRSCTVRVLLKDRTRLYAEVAGPTAGAWTCFAGGSKTCAP